MLELELKFEWWMRKDINCFFIQ